MSTILMKKAKMTKRNVHMDEETEQDLRLECRDLIREISSGLQSGVGQGLDRFDVEVSPIKDPGPGNTAAAARRASLTREKAIVIAGL